MQIDYFEIEGGEHFSKNSNKRMSQEMTKNTKVKIRLKLEEKVIGLANVRVLKLGRKN